MPSAATLAFLLGILPMATSWRRDFNRFGTLPTKGSRTHNFDTCAFRKAVGQSQPSLPNSTSLGEVTEGVRSHVGASVSRCGCLSLGAVDLRRRRRRLPCR